MNFIFISDKKYSRIRILPGLQTITTTDYIEFRMSVAFTQLLASRCWGVDHCQPVIGNNYVGPTSQNKFQFSRGRAVGPDQICTCIEGFIPVCVSMFFLSILYGSTTFLSVSILSMFCFHRSFCN